MGLQEGCPLSRSRRNFSQVPVEWNTHIGGTMIRNSKFWSLSYADDIMLVAKSAIKLQDMMQRMEVYFDYKKTTATRKKSRVVYYFGRPFRYPIGYRKRRKEKWIRKGKEIE